MLAIAAIELPCSASLVHHARTQQQLSTRPHGHGHAWTYTTVLTQHGLEVTYRMIRFVCSRLLLQVVIGIVQVILLSIGLARLLLAIGLIASSGHAAGLTYSDTRGLREILNTMVSYDQPSCCCCWQKGHVHGPQWQLFACSISSAGPFSAVGDSMAMTKPDFKQGIASRAAYDS